VEGVDVTTGGPWSGLRVGVTGHTGFKGAWMALWLSELGASVHGLALEPPTEPSMYRVARVRERLASERIGDIRDPALVRAWMAEVRPDAVFHLAAQSLVRRSYREPLETFATNVMGTAHVLDAVAATPGVRAVVNVTSDKCYENRERPEPYTEHDPMGGRDPYSASKGCAELVAAAYRRSFLEERGVRLASVRAGNVIGGGDWAEDRLVPDLLRAFDEGRPAVLRSPDATRPWQHVLEPLRGYIELAEKLHETPALAGAYNFGPRTHMAATVRDVISIAQSAFGSGDVAFGTEVSGPHEAGLLMLDVSKAKQVLGIDPCLALEAAVDRKSVV
jgi:CDP-glucose 4,6-dehydratase